MLKYIFPLSYPKKSVLKSAIGYFLVYFLSSLLKGTLIYFFGEASTLGLVGGYISLISENKICSMPFGIELFFICV